jgi:hypothetical protein
MRARRLTPFGWVLVLGAVAVAVLAAVAPGASIVLAVVLAIAVCAVAIEGFPDNANWWDARISAERKAEVLARRGPRRGRSRWSTRAPDAPDEPTDAIWARERQRRERRERADRHYTS